MKKSEDPCRRVRIYLDVNSHARNANGHANAILVVEALRDNGCAGAIVLDGYGGAWVSDFPVRIVPALLSKSALIVEWFDSASRIDSLLPLIISFLDDAMVTIEDTNEWRST